MEILEQTNKLMSLRNSLPEYKKLQLHTGLEGFDSPNSFGIYKSTGGKSLGVLGKDFQPINLQHLFDSICYNVEDSNLDVNKIEFKEYRNGQRINFDIATNDFEVSGSPQLNDVFAVKISFQSGFDGKTKLTLNFKTKRLVCNNGAKGWRDDISISYKNTLKNHAKVVAFTEELKHVQFSVENYKKEMESLVNKNINDQQLNDFYKQLLGYSYDDYSSLHKKSQKRLDEINKCVLEESSKLNLTEYALLQGITRYTSHFIGNKGEENYLFGAGAEMSKLAHQILLN